MTNRSARLACLLPLLVLGLGVSLASANPANVGDGIHTSEMLCVPSSVVSPRRTLLSRLNQRIAQVHCYCCGRDSEGHCNHQCCN